MYRRRYQATLLAVGVVVAVTLYLTRTFSSSSVTNNAAGYVHVRGKLRESSKHDVWRQQQEKVDEDVESQWKRLENEYKRRVESDKYDTERRRTAADDRSYKLRRGGDDDDVVAGHVDSVGKTAVDSERSKHTERVDGFRLRAADANRKTADSFNKLIENANKPLPEQQQQQQQQQEEGGSYVIRVNRTGLMTSPASDIVNLKTEYRRRLPSSNSSSRSVFSRSRDLSGSLRGGPARCSLYDVTKDYPRSDPDAADVSRSDCIRLEPGVGQRGPSRRSTMVKSIDGVVVCIYPNKDDAHLSKPLRVHRIWEPHIVKLFIAAVEYLDARAQGHGKFKDHVLPRGARTVGVYDLGANVGQYSLLAAGLLGKRTVAVEPYRPNIYRLHKALILNSLTDKVLVVENAVSDVRDTFELSVVKGDPSGVTLTSQDADKYCTDPTCPPHVTTVFMDDLLEVTNFDAAVMKIDIEGYEHRAFVHSAQLLADIYVPYIFMEWTRMREYYGSELNDSKDKRLVQSMVDKLTNDLDYVAYGANDLRELNPRQWFSWPHDVVWVHRQVLPPSKLL